MSECLDTLDRYCEIVDGKLWCKESYHKRPVGWFNVGIATSGHDRLSIKGRGYLVHRVLFYLTYRYMPEYVDHIDRNPANNDISNIRDASKATNSWNRGVQSNSTSGVRGVSYNNNSASTSKWGAYIKVDGVREWLGSYKTLEDAERVYNEAVRKYSEKGRIIL